MTLLALPFDAVSAFSSGSDLPMKIPLIFILYCCLSLLLFFLFFLAAFGFEGPNFSIHEKISGIFEAVERRGLAGAR